MIETGSQQLDHLVVVHFYEYQRSPAALPAALRENYFVNPFLHTCGNGAKIIAHPEEVVALFAYLQALGVFWRDGSPLMEPGRWKQLQPRHIIFSEYFREAVLASILDRPGTGANNGRGKQNIRVRRKKWVGIHMSWASRAGDFMPGLGYWASGLPGLGYWASGSATGRQDDISLWCEAIAVALDPVNLASVLAPSQFT